MSQDPLISASRCFVRWMTLVLGCIPLLASVGLAQAIVATVAGSGTRGSARDGGPAMSARLEYPAGLALDTAGNLYITDLFNNRVRKVTPQGTITTLAGDGRTDLGPLGDGGPATSARLWYPAAVLPDSAGNQVILQFVTQPPVKLDCGSVVGCVTSRGAMAFDVKSLFDAWYAGDKTFGSVSTLRFPFSIDRSVQGSVVVTLRNSHGVSNSMSFPLPGPR